MMHHPEPLRSVRNILFGAIFFSAGALLFCMGAAQAQNAAPQRPPLILAADQIVLEERFTETYSEENYSLTPASAVREWMKTRLQADGSPGLVRVILLDGQMTRQELKVKGGFKGWFSDDQKYRYEGRIHVRVEYQPAIPGRSGSNAEAQASGFFTVPEDATLNQIDKQVAALTRDLMQRTDLELENNMLRYMPGVVK